MSKIITKKQLDLVMENSIKEADYMVENKDELKLTKQHMDELHKEGHCMCDDKCIVYTEDIKGDDKKMSELLQKLASEKMDCVVVSKEQMDMLHKDGKCECDDNVSLSYEDEMKEGHYMNDMGDDMKKESACNECGGNMVEGICEGCSGMSESDMDEGNEFTKELSDARKEGESTFTVDGKTYKVEPMEETYKKVDHEDRDEFDGRKSKVIGVDSDIKDQRLGEDSEGEETYNYGEDEGQDAKRLKKGHMSKGHMDALKDDMAYDENHEDRDEKGTRFESTEDSTQVSVTELAESVSNTTKKEFLKEDMDFFNKIINYKK
jgi:hypothetical protein|tara:strand:- start:310 stop:1269 length:960 start_codon:yes stop_codon:yes gene_type:complete